MKTLSKILFALSLMCVSAQPQSEQITPDTLPEPPEHQHWKLVFRDEFSGSRIDDLKWEIPPDGKRGTNGFWSRDTVNLDGHGHLRMHRTNDDGKYTGGCIQTRGKFEHTFGYFTSRIRLHSQQGHWPAFWLTGQTMPDIGNGGIDGAEVDIMEKPTLDNQVHHALHWDGYKKPDAKSQSKITDIPCVMQGWHTFSVWWKPDEYIFYVDGNETWRTNAGGACQVPLYIRLTDEMSPWAGDITQAQLPDQWLVDYVRVYDLVDDCK